MGFFSSLFGSMTVIGLAMMCLFGVLALVIIGVIVGAIVWGLKRGKVRITTGERNFDDFGH